MNRVVRGRHGSDRSGLLSRRQNPGHQCDVYLLGLVLPAGLHAGVRRRGELRPGLALSDWWCGLQRLFPRWGAGDGQLWHCCEHGVGILPRSRQRHLLRNADLPAQPRGVPAGQGLVQCPGRHAAGGHYGGIRQSLSGDSDPLRFSAAAISRRHGRDRGLVFLLRHFRLEDPPQ